MEKSIITPVNLYERHKKFIIKHIRRSKQWHNFSNYVRLKLDEEMEKMKLEEQ